MAWWDVMLRRARIRGLREGLVQKARVEALDDSAHDDAERFQDYGFAANPVDGQGLQIEVGGHTLVIRMDRLAERPQLPAYEVAIWHKEGHMVRLRAGRLVQVDCDQLVINASASVAINSPNVSVTASSGVTLTTPGVAASGDVSAAGTVSAPTVAAASSLKVAGKEMAGHVHGGVDTGGGTSGPPA